MTVSIYHLQATANQFCIDAYEGFSRPDLRSKMFAVGDLALARLTSFGAALKASLDLVVRSCLRIAKVVIAPFTDQWSLGSLVRSGAAAVLTVALVALRLLSSLGGIVSPELMFGVLRLHRHLLFLGLVCRSQLYTLGIPAGPGNWMQKMVRDQQCRWAVVCRALELIDDREAKRQDLFRRSFRTEVWSVAVNCVRQRERVNREREEAGRCEAGPDVILVPATPRPPTESYDGEFDDGREDGRESDVGLVLRRDLSDVALPDDEDLFVDDEPEALPAAAAARDDDHVVDRPDVAAALAGEFGRPVDVSHPILEEFQRRFSATVHREALALCRQKVYTKDEVEDMTTAYLAVMNRTTCAVVESAFRPIRRELRLASAEITRTELAHDHEVDTILDVLCADGETASVREERLCTGRVIRMITDDVVGRARRVEQTVWRGGERMGVDDVVFADGRVVNETTGGGLEEWKHQILEILLLLESMSASEREALTYVLCADEERVRTVKPDLPRLREALAIDRCFKLIGELYTTFVAHHMPRDTFALQSAFALDEVRGEGVQRT